MKTKIVDVTELDQLCGNRLWHNGQEYTASCRRVDAKMMGCDDDAELHVVFTGHEFYRISAFPLDMSHYWLHIAKPGDKFEVVVDDHS